MAFKTALDLLNDNFDAYFANRVATTTQQQREQLPEDIMSKLFHSGGKYRANSSFRLTFLQKLFVLWRAMKSRFYIVVEDEEKGLSVEEFFAKKAAIKKRDLSGGAAETFGEAFTFMLGSKELMDGLEYLNDLGRSPAYSYLMRGKNTKKSKQATFKEQRTYILKFLANYEGCKKTMTLKTGMDMSEIMILFVLYPGLEVKSNTLYRDIYRYSYHSSARRMKVSFGTLQSKGYIVKVGGSKATKLKITSLGASKLDEILDKFLLNP